MQSHYFGVDIRVNMIIVSIIIPTLGEYMTAKGVEFFWAQEPIKICSVRFDAKLFAKMRYLASRKGVSFNRYMNEKMEEIVQQDEAKRILEGAKIKGEDTWN